MADKLSWSELRRALAQRANISEKDANTFLTAFNAQLLEALKTEKQVKINGLGTFKLQAVAPRKSVDVTTGSEITIADTGCGYDPANDSEPHLALNNIRQRLEIMCKGTLEISSTPGGGTTVKVVIPEGLSGREESPANG